MEQTPMRVDQDAHASYIDSEFGRQVRQGAFWRGAAEAANRDLEEVRRMYGELLDIAGQSEQRISALVAENLALHAEYDRLTNPVGEPEVIIEAGEET